jgi:hypothetical protein
VIHSAVHCDGGDLAGPKTQNLPKIREQFPVFFQHFAHCDPTTNRRQQVHRMESAFGKVPGYLMSEPVLLVLKLHYYLIVREHTRSCAKTITLLALSVVILACVQPMNADTLPASPAVAPVLDPSLLISASEFPSFSSDLALPTEAYSAGFAFALVPSEAGSFDLLAGRRDTRTESGAEGVRRFLLLAIVFGAALRFLTSPAFYKWAADVFGPLDGYY